MAKLTDEQRELYRALNAAHWQAKKEISALQAQINSGFLETDEYHQRALEQAKTAERWLFVQLMRINPD